MFIFDLFLIYYLLILIVLMIIYIIRIDTGKQCFLRLPIKKAVTTYGNGFR
jgi:hypothetical protein